jgi:hypothetical protein
MAIHVERRIEATTADAGTAGTQLAALIKNTIGVSARSSSRNPAQPNALQARCTASSTNARSMPASQPHQPGSLLRMLSEQLVTHGMEIREHRCGDELTAIAVANPQDPGMGRVVMARNGRAVPSPAYALRFLCDVVQKNRP